MLWHVLCIAAVVVSVAGHGRVLEPPGRSTIWRMGYSARPNYDDDALNCGGFYMQHGVNGGKCGVCGDPYNSPTPRPHEIGGIWGTGTIVANYIQGQVITITVQLTAYHKGFWEFRICTDPLNNEQECFDKNLLELVEGGTKYYPSKDATYTMSYRLPADLVCDHCVMQWRYTCGNNWGSCGNGTQGLGCGDQETFGACSDISIAAIRSVDAPVEVEMNPIPEFLSNSIDEVQGLLDLIHKVAIRPRDTPKRDTPMLYQRKNHRRKHRGKKINSRKRNKNSWNFR